MAGAYTLTLRDGPQVSHARFATLAEALDALEERLAGIAARPPGRPLELHYRTFKPIEQVAARGEVAGPGRLRPAVRAGVDVRGDGSVEAFLGLARRQLVEQRAGESAFDALRRTLAEQGAGKAEPSG